MYDTDRVSPHNSPVHDFRAISMGSADANFEVWQGGKAKWVWGAELWWQVIIASPESVVSLRAFPKL